MPHDPTQQAIRIGTMVDGLGDAPGWIRQTLPHGFESFQVSFWQNTGDKGLDRLAGDVGDTLAGSGAVLSSLGVFGNPLEHDDDAERTRQGWRDLIDAAPRFGVDLVCGFAGRLNDRPIHESMPRFAEVFGPLAARADDVGVRLAFENCDMGGNWGRGHWNIAHDPRAWEMMFNVLDAANVGLEWEPCHQMVSLIEPVAQLKKLLPTGKVFHLHGKDATIHWDRVREHGIHTFRGNDGAAEHGVAPAPPYVEHRTPGFGDTDWIEVFDALRRHGYTGFVDIEGFHDPVYVDALEMTGQVHALGYLKRCRGGDFVPNPVPTPAPGSVSG